MTKRKRTPSAHKLRRDVTGGKRGDGNQRRRAVRRPDPRKIRVGESDATLTGVAGLVMFGAFLRGLGVDRALADDFGRLKKSRGVIYRMQTQMRMLLDLFMAGEHRIFGLEALAADPLFVLLCGGVVPSLDTVYRDLARFDDEGINALEDMMAQHGLAELRRRRRRLRVAHLDIDTTVEPVFGEHEGALPGPNPRYHGRPSYHPVLARIAETDTCVGARLRPGDTSFGVAEVPLIEGWMDRVRAAIGPDCLMYVRIDGAADCADIMSAIDHKGAFFLTKARMTPDLCSAVAMTTRWQTVDRDADGRPMRQVALVDFARNEWRHRGVPVRVIAVRTRDRLNGKQLYLWDDNDYTVQVFLTNDLGTAPEDLAQKYNERAGIEPLIAEFKSAWGIGKVPSASFAANHAALLLKLLAHNLLRRYVAEELKHVPVIRSWRAPWLRRALILIPGRLVRSGRSWELRMPPRPALMPLLN
jgi:Transposase DDE domain group 1